MPVIYSEKMINVSPYLTPSLIALATTFPPNSYIDRNVLNGINFECLNTFFGMLMGMVKSQCWCYEDEWRLLDIFTHSNVHQRDGIDLPLKMPVNGVYLGYKFNEKYIDIIMDIAKKDKLKIYQMSHVKNVYKLEPKLLHDFELEK